MPGIGAITGHLTGKVNYISNLSLALRNYTRVFPMDLSGVGAIQRERVVKIQFLQFHTA